eukprot:167446-Pyramimonas_sp.AAC.2
MSYHEKVLYHKVMVSVRPTRVRTNAASAMLSVGNRRPVSLAIKREVLTLLRHCCDGEVTPTLYRTHQSTDNVATPSNYYKRLDASA